MRTFIAIKIIPEALLLQRISALKQKLSEEPMRWVDEQNFHLTLKFLGETSEMQVAQIKHILADFSVLQQQVSFTLAGLGYFKSRGMPRVLYVDIQHKNALQQLTERIEAFLVPLGFQREKRPFNPHLTLARIKFLKNKQQFYQVVEANQFSSNQQVTVSEIIFYQSLLKSERPIYRELAKYSLSESG